MKQVSFFKRDNLRFTIIAAVWGLLFSFIIIPWQTPDERTHLGAIGAEIGNEDLVELLSNDMFLDQNRIMFNGNEKIDISVWEAAVNKDPEYTISSCMPRKISIQCIRHFPSMLGILLGILLKLPTYWVLHLGEIFSLVFYILIGNMVLSLAAVKKHVFEIVMLLPMCIQQAASINYDAVLLPCCFLLIAYILYLKFEMEYIRAKNILILLIILFPIIMIKLPYALLAGLFFMIPLNKMGIESKKINYLIISSLMVVGSVIAINLLRNYKYMQILIASIFEWRRTLYLFWKTICTFGEHLFVSLVGNFGWLDTPLPMACIIVITLFVLTFSFMHIRDSNDKNNKTHKFNRWDKTILILVTLGTIYITTIALVDHTALIWLYGSEQADVQLNYREALYAIGYIGGLQGRYYLPLLTPALFLLPELIEISREKYQRTMVIAEILIMFCTSYFIIIRYW